MNYRIFLKKEDRLLLTQFNLKFILLSALKLKCWFWEFGCTSRQCHAVDNFLYSHHFPADNVLVLWWEIPFRSPVYFDISFWICHKVIRKWRKIMFCPNNSDHYFKRGILKLILKLKKFCKIVWFCRMLCWKQSLMEKNHSILCCRCVQLSQSLAMKIITDKEPCVMMY